MATKLQITKLLERQQRALLELNAATEALHAALAGEPTPGQRIVSAFEAAWQSRYHQPYVWNKREDIPTIGRLLKLLELDEVELRIPRYLMSNDRFYVENRHLFRYFARDINKLTDAPISNLFEGAAPADCRHEPPCTTDAQHTRKRRAEFQVID